MEQLAVLIKVEQLSETYSAVLVILQLHTGKVNYLIHIKLYIQRYREGTGRQLSAKHNI